VCRQVSQPNPVTGPPHACTGMRWCMVQRWAACGAIQHPTQSSQPGKQQGVQVGLGAGASLGLTLGPAGAWGWAPLGSAGAWGVGPAGLRGGLGCGPRWAPRGPGVWARACLAELGLAVLHALRLIDDDVLPVNAGLQQVAGGGSTQAAAVGRGGGGGERRQQQQRQTSQTRHDRRARRGMTDEPDAA